MPIVALARVNLRESLGDLGDRYNVGVSTSAIASNEWHLEANYHFGSIGDVSLYRNLNANAKGSTPDWQWYGAIPTANIKSYALANPLPPQALPKDESQAETQAEVDHSAASAAQ